MPSLFILLDVISKAVRAVFLPELDPGKAAALKDRVGRGSRLICCLKEFVCN